MVRLGSSTAANLFTDLYFSYLYSIVKRADRIARELDASAELET